MREISIRVPGMTSRHGVRLISTHVSDVAGVQTVEVDLDTKTVRVTGDAHVDAIRAAITAAGFDVSG